MGLWNVRTLWQTGKYQLLKNELTRYRVDILGLCEVRWTGVGEMDEGRMIWSGGQDHQRGVGLLMTDNAKKALNGYNVVNDRLMYAKFTAYPRDIIVIVAYAPTADHSKEEIETFHRQVEDVMSETPPKAIKFILGDWNAKIGSDCEGYEDVMGRHGIGERNESGEMLLELAKRNSLYIANTKFQGKLRKKATWVSPDGKTKNMIDFIMMEQKWRTFIKNCRSFPGANIDSDHTLVLCNFEMKLKSKRQERYPWQMKYNTQKMRDSSEIIQDRLNQIWKEDKNIRSLDEEVSKITEGLRQVASEYKIKKVPNKPWISSRTLEIVEKRNRNRNRQSYEYKELNKQVKKSARTDKNCWIQERCKLIQNNFGSGKSREAYKLVKQIKGNSASQIRAVKDKNGKTLTDDKDIMDRWAEYIKELYTDTNQYGDRILADLQARTVKEMQETDDSILKREVEKAIKKLKNEKSCGVDGIPAELIKAGGENVVARVWKLCNEIWRTEKWPEEWCKSMVVPLHKKGDMKECSNYRTIALIPHVCKTMLNILQERLRGAVEKHLSEEQGGFRPDRSTVQQILTIRLIAENVLESGQKLYHCFVDFKKAFDSVWHDGLWASLEALGVQKKLVRVIKALYQQSTMAVRTKAGLTNWIQTTIGCRQGDPLSPILFLVLLEKIMEKLECKEGLGVMVQGKEIKDLRFADDIDQMSKSKDHLQEQVNELNRSGEEFGLFINIDKTKVMVMGETSQVDIQINGQKIECVDQFVYLGSLITKDNDCSKEVRRRIGVASGSFGALTEMWESGEVSINVKLMLLESCVMSTLMYACETWTLKKTDRDRLNAFEMECYRKILGVKWQDKVRNEDIRKKLGKMKPIAEKVVDRKMELFGHICRMSDDRLIKLVLFAKGEGKRKQGRPRKKWVDDIKERCGLTLQEARQLACDRGGFWSRRPLRTRSGL